MRTSLDMRRGKLRPPFAFVAAAIFAGVCSAQTQIPQPTGSYYGGVLLSDDYMGGVLQAPAGVQLNLQRRELSVQSDGQYTRDVTITQCHGPGACYGTIDYALGYGPGLINGSYIRLDGRVGGGPVVGRKLAVRGAPQQWAVWGEQINLGPGAKAAIWIGGDNPQLEGRAYDTVSHGIVFAGDLNITGAAIQRNAPPDGMGMVLRVFQGGRVTAELTEGGTLRVRRVELIP